MSRKPNTQWKNFHRNEKVDVFLKKEEKEAVHYTILRLYEN